MQPNKKTQDNQEMQLIVGVIKHFGKGDSIILAGKRYTTGEVEQWLQERIDARTAAAHVKAVWQDAIQHERNVLARTKPALSSLRQALLAMFSPSIDVLADLGLKPRKQPRPFTVEEKKAIVARVQATRKARHTMGIRQRERIHGSAPSDAVTEPRPPPIAATNDGPRAPDARASMEP